MTSIRALAASVLAILPMLAPAFACSNGASDGNGNSLARNPPGNGGAAGTSGGAPGTSGGTDVSAATRDAASHAVGMTGGAQSAVSGARSRDAGAQSGRDGGAEREAGGTSSPDAATNDAGSSKCPTLEMCAGDRGNTCGGVISGPHFLYGTQFDQYEGARVIAAGNHATIKNGSFRLDAGDYSGCGAKPVAYRIDVSPNGHCDDGTDLVFVYTASGGIVIDEYVTATNPGTPSTCAEFPTGYDLDLAVVPDCFVASQPALGGGRTCGSVEVAVYENDAPVGSPLGVFFDQAPPFQYTLTGILTPGHTYELHYYWAPMGHSCSGTTDVWHRTFTGAEGVTTVPIVADNSARPGPCQ